MKYLDFDYAPSLETYSRHNVLLRAITFFQIRKALCDILVETDKQEREVRTYSELKTVVFGCCTENESTEI